MQQQQQSQPHQQQQGGTQYGVPPDMASFASPVAGPRAHIPAIPSTDHHHQQLPEAASPISSRPPPSSQNFSELVIPPSSAGSSHDEDAGDDTERGSTPGNRWPREETLALIKIRSEMDAAFREATLKGPLWDDVSRKLAELGYIRSAKKCKEKFENVHKYYKRTKEGRAGRQDGKSYRFFSQLEALHSGGSGGGGSIAPPTTMANPITSVPTTTSIPVMPPPSIGRVLQQQPPVSSPPVAPAATPAPAPQVILPSPATIPAGISFSSDTFSSSFSESDGEDTEEGGVGGGRKRKREGISGGGGGSRKMIQFFEGLMMQVMERQEAMQQRFLETIEKREQDRIIREAAWKRQEMARLNREHEILAQERAMAASRDAAVISFLNNIGGQVVLPATAMPAASPPQPQQIPQQQQQKQPPPSLSQPQQPQQIPQQKQQKQPPPSLSQPQQPQQIPQQQQQKQPPPSLSQPQQPQQIPQQQQQKQPPPPLQIQQHPQQNAVPPAPAPPSSEPQPPQPPPPQKLHIPHQSTTEIVVRNQPPPSSTTELVPYHEPHEASGVGAAVAASGAFEGGVSPSRWPKSEVHALIKLRSGLEGRYQEAGPKGPLWEEISAGMQRLGYNRNPKRCKEKWENINKYFKKVKESNKKRPEDAKTCPYFHQLDALYRNKLIGNALTGAAESTPPTPNPNPQQLSISMAPPLPQHPHPIETGMKSANNNNEGSKIQVPTRNGGLQASIFQEGTSGSGGTSTTTKKPEDTVKELMMEQQHMQASTMNDHDIYHEDDDGDEDGDDDDEEERKIVYQMQFQRQNGTDGAGNVSAKSAATTNTASSFLAMVQ